MLTPFWSFLIKVTPDTILISSQCLIRQVFNIEIVNSALWAPMNVNISHGRLIVFVRRAYNYGYRSKFKPNSEIIRKNDMKFEKVEFLLTITVRVSPF